VGDRSRLPGKKVIGRKRHLVVDALSLLLVLHVTSDSVQDRNVALAMVQELPREVAAELRNLSRPRGCQVFSSDARVRVLATGLTTYPDVSVVCGPIERDPDGHNAITNPSVEVYPSGVQEEPCGARGLAFRQG
jgi:hypothetical protein